MLIMGGRYIGRQKGDTLIEVLFAVTVFSLVAVGALTIMNQGSAASQRALEITLVRQAINNQAETLRFLDNSYVAAYHAGQTYDPATPAGQWALMEASILQTNAQVPGAFGTSTTTCPTPPTGSFILDSINAKFEPPSSNMLKPAVTYAQLVYSSGANPALSESQGISIEAVRSPTDPAQPHVGYIDFYIQACWDSFGQTQPVTIGTIVRLYAPR